MFLKTKKFILSLTFLSFLRVEFVLIDMGFWIPFFKLFHPFPLSNPFPTVGWYTEMCIQLS